MSKKCIIFDLDGTLRDLTHRLHYIKGPKKDYDAFHANVLDDEPKHDIIYLNEMLAGYADSCVDYRTDYPFEIFILSGCSESARKDTISWLSGAGVSWDRLWMRPEGDYQPDVELKRSWLHKIQEEGYEVIFTVDDRQGVVDMWRDEGITCLQCDAWDEDGHDSYIPMQNAHLHVLVGPSGAGKTTTFENMKIVTKRPLMYIGTDAIRQELCDDFKDQSKNDATFEIYHKEIQHHLECGRPVVADATNIRARDRKKLLALLPDGVEATYHIIDRPLEDKLKTGGWRLDVYIERHKKGLIEYHHDIFQSSQRDALKGDNDPRVTVIDHRDF